jgi:hypothetical protein
MSLKKVCPFCIFPESIPREEISDGRLAIIRCECGTSSERAIPERGCPNSILESQEKLRESWHENSAAARILNRMDGPPYTP